MSHKGTEDKARSRIAQLHAGCAPFRNAMHVAYPWTARQKRRAKSSRKTRKSSRHLVVAKPKRVLVLS